MKKATRDYIRKILEDDFREKYPTVRFPIVTIYPDTNEKGIKKNIKQVCNVLGYKYLDTDSKAVRTMKQETLKHASGVDRVVTNFNYRKSHIEKGHHDCEVSKNNKLWCIEIKAQNVKTKYKDKQSDVQKEFQKKLKDKFGNDYYIVRGMDDFIEIIGVG